MNYIAIVNIEWPSWQKKEKGGGGGEGDGQSKIKFLSFSVHTLMNGFLQLLNKILLKNFL